MQHRSPLARLLDRIGPDAAPAPLTPLLDEHLAQVAGGSCGCGHSSSSNHASSGSGPNHRSQTSAQQLR